MLDQLLEEVNEARSSRLGIRPELEAASNSEELRGLIAEKIEDLRREDTTKLSRLWSLMTKLMERDDVKLSDGSIDLGHEDVGAEEAFIILLTDLLVAAYEATYQPVG